jgi:hypothetical protein
MSSFEIKGIFLINKCMANFTNLNLCFSTTETFGTTVKTLCTYSCSEVYIYNAGTSSVNIYDQQSCSNPILSGNSYFSLPSGKDVTIRGITNSNEVSAACVTGTAALSYRTQFFSSFPLTVY